MDPLLSTWHFQLILIRSLPAKGQGNLMKVETQVMCLATRALLIVISIPCSDLDTRTKDMESAAKSYTLGCIRPGDYAESHAS